MKSAFSCVPLLILAGCSTVPAGTSREAILAVDEQQRAMVTAGDLAGLERLAHANLRINAPAGRVLSREQFLANMRSGEIGAEAFTRTPEDVTVSVSGKVGSSWGASPLPLNLQASSAVPTALSRYSGATPMFMFGSTDGGSGSPGKRRSSPRQRAEEGAPGQSRAPQPISYWPASARYCAGVTGPIA